MNRETKKKKRKSRIPSLMVRKEKRKCSQIVENYSNEAAMKNHLNGRTDGRTDGIEKSVQIMGVSVYCVNEGFLIFPM